VQRAILKLIPSPAGLGHPYLAPPGIPPQRLALLRNAFAVTLRDNPFLAEVEKLQIAIEPIQSSGYARLRSFLKPDNRRAISPTGKGLL
jgi:hypothetical protein